MIEAQEELIQWNLQVHNPPLTQSEEVLLIGDALAPRTIAEATFEGNAVGAFLDLDLALRTLEH